MLKPCEGVVRAANLGREAVNCSFRYFTLHQGDFGRLVKILIEIF